MLERGHAPQLILQLGAGPLMIHSIGQLRDGGYRVFAVDRNPHSPGFALADGHAVVDIISSPAITNIAREIHADLILAINEAGVLAAAEASVALGLPGLSPEVARRALDKGLMRDCWETAGLRQPAYRVVEDALDIPTAAASLGYPIIVKPALNWGSRGVSFVSGRDHLSFAIDFARQHCRNGRYIVEQAVVGTEMTLEGLVQDGECHILALSDKEAQFHPSYRVAMALNYPAYFDDAIILQAHRLAKAAVEALGLRNSAFHCECMVTGADVVLIELGARPGGGHIFGEIVEAVSGVCMPQALAAILLGRQIDARARHQRGACYRFFSPPPGIFQGVEGLEQARDLPGVLDIGFEMELGTRVRPIAGDADRPGFVVTTGTTRDDAMAAAARAIEALRFDMAESDHLTQTPTAAST
jgi:biotin carboxylase